MKRYIIIYNNGYESILHSDGKCYYSFINMRGCYVITYKRYASALKKVNTLNKMHNSNNFYVKEL